MSGFEHTFGDGFQGDGEYLESYRAMVERLRSETASELGFLPMPPEKVSMIAVILAALPLAVLTTPAIPVQPDGWAVGLTLLAVWLIAFRVQSLRWDRFQAHWHRKIAAWRDMELSGPAGSLGM